MAGAGQKVHLQKAPGGVGRGVGDADGVSLTSRGFVVGRGAGGDERGRGVGLECGRGVFECFFFTLPPWRPLLCEWPLHAFWLQCFHSRFAER